MPAWINEFHYDNDGTDIGEFVEIAGPTGTDLTGWSLVLYNGTPSQRSPYNTIELTGTLADAGDGIGFTVLDFPSNGIQNGAPDGMALVDQDGNVVQFLSYEGTFEAAAGPAAGLISTDIGVQETSSTPVGFSLQLTGAGTEAADFEWAPEAAATPDAANNGQAFDEGSGGPVIPPAPEMGDLTFNQLDTIQLDGAEIVAFDPKSMLAFVTSGDGLAVVDASDPTNLVLKDVIAEGVNINSVAVSQRVIAIAVPADDRTENGKVMFFNRETLELKAEKEVGPNPDDLKFSDNGRRLVVANEGESSGDENEPDADVNPVGSISIIKVNQFFTSRSQVTTLELDHPSITFDALEDLGVRVNRDAPSAGADLEPEYVTISGDTAYISLQENNAILKIDDIFRPKKPTIDDIIPLGTKDHAIPGAGLDASNRDEAINIANYDINGLYMADQLATIEVAGQTYILTANEGDGRDVDESRGGDLVDGDLSNGEIDTGEVLAELQSQLADDAQLGRLKFSTVDGDIDGDGLIEELHAFGGRSFSIYDAETGAQVFDSGDDFEVITANVIPELFNANDGDPDEFDERSDDKGPEPEAITIGEVDGQILAFIALERTGGIMVYDVSDPENATFEKYITIDGDVSPEGLQFISAEDSPTGQSLLAIANEESNTLSFVSFGPTSIPQIQGKGHTSPYLGQVVDSGGIVTAVDTNGFYLQDPDGDGDIATSDALFIFTGGAPGVAVGDEIVLTGTVSEFTPGGTSSGNLSSTQISSVSSLEVVSSGNDLPDAVIIGADGRVVPNANIDDDAFASFDPEEDGIDFFESLEGMRVTAEDLVAVSGTNRFGEIFAVNDPASFATSPKYQKILDRIESLEEFFGDKPWALRAIERLKERAEKFLPDDAPSGLSDRGTLNISPDDFNPEKIQIDADSGVFDFDFPTVDVGAELGDVTGVVSYSFGNFEIIPTEDFTGNIVESDIEPEVTDIAGAEGVLSFASYNVLNLDPNDADGDTDVADGRFASIAEDIVVSLGSPYVIALQEIQDSSGSDNDGTISAADTLDLLTEEIYNISGIEYEWADNIFIGDGTSGGQPGGNIRTAYLYNPDYVTLIEGSLATIDGQGPGEAFEGARLPLVATFEFEGDAFTFVNVHLSSKGGSAPIFGTSQPFETLQEDTSVNGSLDERQLQADGIADFVGGLTDENVIVLGDFNEFEFISPVELIEDQGLVNLTNSVDEDERYSFIFQGNSQSLDHILVSEALAADAEFDIVHLNSEFASTADRSSDHDPLVGSVMVDTFEFV